MNSIELSALAGSVSSLLFSRFPVVKAWFGALDPNVKSIVNLCLLGLVAVGIYATSCLGWYPSVSCDNQGVLELVKVFLAALVGSQSTYLATKKL